MAMKDFDPSTDAMKDWQSKVNDIVNQLLYLVQDKYQGSNYTF